MGTDGRTDIVNQKALDTKTFFNEIRHILCLVQRIPVADEDNIVGKLSDERFMKMSKGYEEEQHTLQTEADIIQNELQQEEKKSVDVKRFLAIVKKYTDLTELTPEILREFVDKIIVHAPDKSSGRRLQEIEIIYNHIGEFDHSKVTLWKGNAV